MAHEVTNVLVAGLGGQGVLKASDIVADAAFRAGLDVKKSEIHGMSQRGGSVTSDVRFGKGLLSPMIPTGEADFLLVLASDQLEPNRHQLRPGGVLIMPELIEQGALPHPRSLNVALAGVLSTYLDIPESHWLDAIRSTFKKKIHEVNLKAFAMGRAVGKK